MSCRFGRFLELSLPVNDIRASLGFYRDLGFTEIPTNDIRDYYYAVVSDGRIAIGLHGSAIDTPALSFVQADVAQRARELEAIGIEILSQRLGSEHFNEAEFDAPDHQRVKLLEAPTFSAAVIADLPEPAVGRIRGVTLPSRFPHSAAAFWERHGLVVDEHPDDASARVVTPGLVLNLDSGFRGRGPALEFAIASADELEVLLERRGIEARRRRHWLSLTAPEGTELIVQVGPHVHT